MNDEAMIRSSRAIVLAIETVSDRHLLDGDDRVSLTTMALAEMLGRWLGPDTANYLRRMADVIEANILNGNQAG